MFTTPRVVDHSTLTTSLQALLWLHAIHLLLCRSVCSFAVFFGRWCSLVFVFVAFLQLYFGCKFAALLLLCVPLFCLCCNFYIFSFILLSVLLYLPTMTWFNLEVEIVLWVLASIWCMSCFISLPWFWSWGGDCFVSVDFHLVFCSACSATIILQLCSLEIAYGSFWTIGNYHYLMFGSYGPDQYLSLYLYCFFFIIWSMLLRHPSLVFWVYCWGAYPFFIYRISYFFL